MSAISNIECHEIIGTGFYSQKIAQLLQMRTLQLLLLKFPNDIADNSVAIYIYGFPCIPKSDTYDY